MSKRNAVLYARLSVTTEESVSIERQLEAGRKYCSARGWTVVGEFTDDGVSATKNKPEDREGWRALLDHDQRYNVAVVWKVDRLARRALDFLHADEDLQSKGAGLVAVEDPIDMTTAQGRAFATMLAVFAEMEAAAISARLKSARRHLIQNGRVAGGLAPYGWRNVANPDGAGLVLAHDPERIDWVRAMVARAQRGDSTKSICKWLDEQNAPLPRTSKRAEHQSWRHGAVGSILRNPVLAGQIVYNPGNAGKRRGGEVLRDERGLPVAHDGLGVMDAEEWRAMVAALDSRSELVSRPRSGTGGLLSGLIWCGDPSHDEPQRMWRRSQNGAPAWYCGGCYQLISNIDSLLVEEFLHQKGDWVRWSKVTEVYEGGAAELPEVEHRLTELDDLIRDATNREDRTRLRAQQDDLYELRDELRQKPGEVVERWSPSDHYFSELWAQAEDVEARRAVLDDALERVVVQRGSRGRQSRQQVLDRLDIAWKRPEELGPRPQG